MPEHDHAGDQSGGEAPNADGSGPAPVDPSRRLEQRASSVADLAGLVVRLRLPLALAVLGLVFVNRLVLHSVSLPRDWPYLLVGWLPGGGGTLELPYEAPWLVLPVLALVLFVAVPRWWAWALVVVGFVLPHAYPYRAGPIELWGVRLVELTGEVVPLLHLPLLVLIAVLAVLVAGRPRPGDTTLPGAVPPPDAPPDAPPPDGPRTSGVTPPSD